MNVNTFKQFLFKSNNNIVRIVYNALIIFYNENNI